MKASIVLLVLAFAACGRVADDSKTVIVPERCLRRRRLTLCG